MHQVNDGSYQTPTVEEKNNIKKACSCIWNGRNHAKPANETTPEMARPRGPHETFPLAQQLLFGELEKKRPSHGTKRRWRDIAVTDIKAVGNDDSWYDYAQDRQAWEALCKDGLLSLTEQQHSHCPSGIQTTDRPTSYPCQC